MSELQAQDRMKLEIKEGSPAFAQLAAQLGAMIAEGRMKPGHKLSSERTMSLKLGLSRGTVRKAYEELAHGGLVEVVHGRGYFVAGAGEAGASRQSSALKLIDELLDRMESLRFTNEQVLAMVDLRLARRREHLLNLHVLAVDCNIEALAIYERQLGLASQVNIEKMLLSDIRANSRRQQQLADFAIILVSTTHHGELLDLLPCLKDRIVPVAVTVGQSTVVGLAGIRSAQRVGVLCRSPRFLSLIKEKLSLFGVVETRIKHMLLGPGPVPDLGDFLADRDVLVIPPGLSVYSDRHKAAAVNAFTRRGGRIIVFDHQIERGSILHVQDRIRQIISRAE